MSVPNPPSASYWLHLLPPAVFVLFFTLPPFPSRRLVVLSTTLVLAYLCLTPSSPVGGGSTSQMRYGASAAWLYYLGWLAKLLLHRPEHDFWRVGSEPHEAERMTFGLAKLRWACSLLAAPRGVGWNFQPPDLLPPPPPDEEKALGRTRFALRRLAKAAVFYIAADAVAVFLARQHFRAPHQTVADLPLHWRVILELAVALGVWCNTELQFAVWSFVLVALGLSEEKDFPSLFGDITAVVSLAGFWGKFWHQNLRLMFHDYGHLAMHLLHVHHGTALSWFVRIWTAFLISGAMHALACWTLSPVPPFDGFYERFMAIFVFFILQAVGITVEALYLQTPVMDIVLYEFGLQDEIILGRLWTFGWLLFSGQWALECWLKTEQGMLQVPYSIVTPLLEALKM